MNILHLHGSHASFLCNLLIQALFLPKLPLLMKKKNGAHFNINQGTKM